MCQISYLTSFSEVNDPTTNLEAKTLFGVNISSKLVKIIMSLVILILRERLLKHENNTKEAMHVDAKADVEMSMKAQSRDSLVVDIGQVYPKSTDNDSVIATNPLLRRRIQQNLHPKRVTPRVV